MNGDEIDVNVHPTKMELRFQRQQEVYNTVFEGVHRTLLEPELIQKAEVPDPIDKSTASDAQGAGARESGKVSDGSGSGPSPFLLRPKPAMAEKTVGSKTDPVEKAPEVKDEDYFIRKMRERVLAYHERSSSAEVKKKDEVFRPETQKERIRDTVRQAVEENVSVPDGLVPENASDEVLPVKAAEGTKDQLPPPEKPRQMDLFEENFLKREVKAEYKLIGQVFDTYWLVEFRDSLYIIDQHAAHERVLYERTLKGMKNREFTSQYLSPPIILNLSMKEAQLLNENMDRFARIGFEIEPFGGEEYAVRAVPDNLFSIAKKDLLMEMIDDLSDGISTTMTPELIDEKVASMSCKAAVKGNNRLSAQEVDALIGELLTLDNPYHCPHGRPTIIAMTRRELEKKFKRIV